VELRRYFEIVLRWWWIIVVGAFLAGGTAYLVSSQLPPIYEASTTLLINQATNLTVTDLAALTISERLAKTYGELLHKRPLMEQVIAELDLELTPDELADKISVQPVRDTQLLDATVQDSDPVLAATLANKITETFIRVNQEMQVGRLSAAKESLARQIEDLEEKIAATETTIATMGDPIDEYDKMEMARLQDTLARYRSTWSSLLESYQEITLTEIQSTGSVIIVEPAGVPQEPVAPKTIINTVLATLAGAIIGLGVVFLVEYLDDTIKTGDDVQETLGLSTLGVVGLINLNGRDDMLVTAKHPRAAAAEAFRVLRANVQFLGVDRPVRTIMVTSAGPAEGKSLTTANLGLVMAQAGLSVVLVDSDLRRPALHRAFDLPRDNGLTNALIRQEAALNLDDYLQPTPFENLRVLTSGPLPPNPADLLGSRRMGELIQEISKQADVVLFDSPPALVVADASLLASKVDGVLLVVEAGGTPRELVSQARETLEQAGARLLGVLLNKLSPRRSGGYYYYYGRYYAEGHDG
jgi:capsular exopolysaccharide synthesis family protein